jgi:hypothetical protein
MGGEMVLIALGDGRDVVITLSTPIAITLQDLSIGAGWLDSRRVQTHGLYAHLCVSVHGVEVQPNACVYVLCMRECAPGCW